MLARKAVVLAKVESAYGADASPVVGDDAILCSEPQIKPLGKRLERDFVRSSLSPLEPLIIAEMYELTFKTELKGSGTVDTPPEIGPLFLGSAFAETIVASTSVAYDLISESFDSLSIYFNRAGLLHKMLGSRGSPQAVLEVSEYGIISWTFRGIYAGPADVALVDGTFNALKPPVCVGATFTMGGYSPVARKLEVNINNTFGRRDDMAAATGVKEVTIVGRDTKGSFDPEAVLVATKDFFDIWENATPQALSCLVGSSAGNICTISGPKCVYDDMGYGARDGQLTFEVPFTMAQDTGDDEVQFLFT